MHAMAYLWKWEQLAFPTILQYHVHDYYQSKRLQHPMITVTEICPSRRVGHFKAPC